MSTYITFKFSIIRLLVTPVLLLAYQSPLIMAVLLLVLDVVDCSRFHLYFIKEFGSRDEQCTHNYLYQATDKLIDIFQYAIAILILCKYVGSPFHTLSVYLLAWRTIGVMGFIYSKNTIYLVPFFDCIKEILVLWWLCNGTPSSTLVFIVCIAKIIFETWKNGNKIVWWDVRK